MHSIVEKLGWKLIDSFDCELLRNKMREYLATSLDGWIVMRYNEEGLENDLMNSDSEGSDVSMAHRHFNCGLEIKTPSSKKIIQDTIRNASTYVVFSQCEFGTPAFKQLVYKPEYRTKYFVMLWMQTSVILYLLLWVVPRSIMQS